LSNYGFSSILFCEENSTNESLPQKSCHSGLYLEDGVKATLEELITGVSIHSVEGVR
jgi:hypothetical protein